MELLISAILDAVFASLADSIGLSDWLRDRLGRDPEKLAFRAALTQALADASEDFPGRDLRYFAELLRDLAGPLLARSLQPVAPLPTSAELTEVWLSHLNLDSVVYYKADFEHFAALFLASLHTHLENQPALQWIAQLRTQKITADAARRSADAAEQSMALLANLRDELQRFNERLDQQSTISTAGAAAIGGSVTTGHDFVGRDRITIRNYFTDGLGYLHIDYSIRIEEFLLEYLGSRRRRVPFGGRVTQLTELDAWLDDRNAPPYYLMTAEAGRGKSALVCRWQVQTLTRPDVAVIFIPISIRFETATQDVVFAALAARLAAIHGETMQAAAISADQWRATCQTYLRRPPPNGKQLLVILDGLDEATGWTPGRGLFPGDPPEGLRVLVTARQRAGEIGSQGWATALGWDDEQLARKCILTGLDRVGVQEVLASIGNPLDQLAAQVDVVSELYRLTAGDPLLVRLYVDALVGKGKTVAYLRAEDLMSIMPGLQGYFDRWWDEQHQQWKSESRDPLVEQEKLLMLLNAVAAALGPLTHSDLAAVSDLTNGVLVRRLAQTVGRWLIGDGKSQGYTFSHPRLGYYFWEQLGKDEQSMWNARFIRWGAATIEALNSGTLNVKAAPRYLIQHYAAHLERGDAPADQYYALISDGWRKAWEEVDVSYSGFLNDMAHAQAQAQQAYQTKVGQAEAIVQGLKGALCRASITALGSNLTPALLTLAVTYGFYTPTQVLAMIHLMPDKAQQVQALTVLVPHFPQDVLGEALAKARVMRDEYDRARILHVLAPQLPAALLDEALAIARAMRDKFDRAPILSALAPQLPADQQAQVFAEALAAARAIEHEYDRATTLRVLAPQLPAALLDEALAIARAIKHDYDRAPILSALAPQLPAALLDEALAIARAMQDASSRAIALSALAPQLPADQQEQVFTEALAAARAVEHAASRAIALSALAPQLPADQQAQVFTEALAAARAIEHAAYRAATLSALAPQLPAALLDEALAAARAIEHDYDRAPILSALAPQLPAALLDEALAIARAMRDAASRATTLSAVAPQLPADQQAQVFTEALAAARAIEREHDRATTLSALAPQLPTDQQAQVFAEALAIARAIGNASSRATTLSVLAPHLPVILGEALAIARAMRDEYDRARILRVLAPQLPAAVLDEALAAARAVEHAASRATTLSALAPQLPADQQEQVFTEALAAARAIEREHDRATTLSALAPQLPAALLDEALAIARAIEHEYDRATTLSALAPQLPADQQAQVFAEALAVARAMRDDYHRAPILSALAPQLPAALLDEALAIARAIKHDYDRAPILSALAPQLPADQQAQVFTEALAIARARQDAFSRARLLSALAPQLPADQQEQVFTEALAAARAIEREYDRATTLSALAPQLPAALLDEALAIARAIEHDYDRATTLSALAPQLPADQQAQVFAEALAVARAMRDEYDRARILRMLAPQLPAALLGEALAIARAIGDTSSDAATLQILSPYFTRWKVIAPKAMYLSYSNALQRLSLRPRPEFLRALEVLLPFILSLADDAAPQAAAGIFYAMRDICTWWP